MRYLSTKICRGLRSAYKKTFTDVIRLQSGCKGTGGAGAIREAGGAFKKMGIAKESQYFYNKERELLKKMKESMKCQKDYHEEQIALHKAAIEEIEHKEKSLK